VKVAFLPKAPHAPAGAWVLAVLENPDQAGALGYHSVDAAGREYVTAKHHPLGRASRRMRTR
jgi:hypothetical protein